MDNEIGDSEDDGLMSGRRDQSGCELVTDQDEV